MKQIELDILYNKLISFCVFSLLKTHVSVIKNTNHMNIEFVMALIYSNFNKNGFFQRS